MMVLLGVLEFILYSDNCSGQNKNHFVPAVFVHAAVKYGVTITHRFLETGHSYNAADNCHSLIERKTKPHDIYVPSQWYDLMRKAKRNKVNTMNVIEVTQKDIFDIKKLADKMNLMKDVTGKNVPWSKIREVSVHKDSPRVLKFRLSLNEDTTITMNTRSVGHPVNFENYNFSFAYDAPLKISYAKKKDLMDMCKAKAIPVQYHEEYDKIPAEEKPPPKPKAGQPTAGNVPAAQDVTQPVVVGENAPGPSNAGRAPAEPSRAPATTRAPAKRSRAPAKSAPKSKRAKTVDVSSSDDTEAEDQPETPPPKKRAAARNSVQSKAAKRRKN